MLLVVVLLMLIYHIQQPNQRIRLTQPIPWPYAIIAMGYIVFWAALRSGFADTSAYVFSFNVAPVGTQAAFEGLNKGGKSPYWGFLQILFKTHISSDFHWWLAAIAILSGIPLMLVFRKKSVDYLFSVFLFIASTTFSWMFNGIRQFVAAVILFGFYYLLIERKRLLFIGIILLCSLIHTSAIIMLPAVFFIEYKPFGKMMSFFVILVLGSAFYVGSMMDTMDVILNDSAYHENLSQFVEDDGAHPLRVLFEFIPVVMAFIKRKQIAALNNSFINLSINMSTVSAGLYFIAMLTSGIMIGRLPIYFSLYNFILIPFLINYIYTSYKKLLYTLFFIIYLAFYFLLTPHYYYISDILGNYL